MVRSFEVQNMTGPREITIKEAIIIYNEFGMNRFNVKKLQGKTGFTTDNVRYLFMFGIIKSAKSGREKTYKFLKNPNKIKL